MNSEEPVELTVVARRAGVRCGCALAGGLSHRTGAQCIGRRDTVHLFGLTGGIASGKSAVAARLRARLLPVIDADELAREAVARGSEGLAALVAAFGSEVLTAEGDLDRKHVARIVFQDAGARAKLNAIVHPRIGALTAARSAELAERGEPLVCYEAALIVENGLAGIESRTVVGFRQKNRSAKERRRISHVAKQFWISGYASCRRLRRKSRGYPSNP